MSTPADGTTSGSEGAQRVDGDLLDIALLLVITTPAFSEMRRHPEMHHWAADLVRFSERDDLRPLSTLLEMVASNALVGDPQTGSFAPLLQGMHSIGSTIGLDTLMKASEAAEQSAADTPYASFVLAWVILCVWILAASARRERLYGEEDPWPGMPHPGWAVIPAVCLALAIRLQGLYGAEKLASHAYEVLQTSRRRHVNYGHIFDKAIAKYRRLGQSIATQYEMAIANLADDLREACRERQTRPWSTVGALFWSLGLVPESYVFRDAVEPPTRAQLRALVQRSISCLPTDPLIQYIWLELKDDSDFDLRSHKSLFAVINHGWDQWRLDDQYGLYGFAAEPSRLYARALMKLLSGEIDEKEATEFLQAYDWISDRHLPMPNQGFLMQRLNMLRRLIGKRFDYFRPEITEADHIDDLKDQLVGAGRRREEALRYPERPDALGRTSVEAFDFIERCLANEADLNRTERERCSLVFDTMETVRAAALAYWLRVNPPLTLIAKSVEAEKLQEEELNLLDGLRGAYYMILRPSLPLSFAWSDMWYGDYLDLRDPEYRRRFYSPDRARDEMKEIEGQLGKLAERSRPIMPEYADRRMNQATTVQRIAAALGRHRRQGPTEA